MSISIDFSSTDETSKSGQVYFLQWTRLSAECRLYLKVVKCNHLCFKSLEKVGTFISRRFVKGGLVWSVVDCSVEVPSTTKKRVKTLNAGSYV